MGKTRKARVKTAKSLNCGTNNDLLRNVIRNYYRDFLFACYYYYIEDKRGNLIRLVPNRIQRTFLNNMTGRDIILKARQMGITTIIQALFFWLANTQYNIRNYTVNYNREMTRLVLEKVKTFLKNLPPELMLKMDVESKEAYYFSATNSKLNIGTAGATTVGETKTAGRSITISNLHCTEVAFFPDAEAVMPGLLSSVPLDYGIIALESTANGVSGYFYDEYQKAVAGIGMFTRHFFPWFMHEEYQIPLKNGEEEEIKETLTIEEKEKINRYSLTFPQIKFRRSKQRELGRFFLQEFPETEDEAFLSARGRVYPNFDEQNIIEKQNITFKRKLAGVDWGTRNPFVIVVGGEDYDGRIVIIEEVYKVGLSEPDFIREAQAIQRKHPEIEAWYCDPSGAGHIQSFQNVGINAYPADNSVIDGINEVEKSLRCDFTGTPGLVVFNTCVNTIREMKAYRFGKDIGGVRREVPEKQNDHCPDAIRYLVKGAKMADIFIGAY